MASKLGSRLAPKRFPRISWGFVTMAYLQGIVVVGTLLSRYENLQMIGGEGGRQIVIILQTTAPITAIVILLSRVLQHKATSFEKAFLWIVLPARVILGVSSGWMGSAVALGLVCAITYLKIRHKLPMAPLVCLIPYILFFQAGKQDFRRTFWNNQVEAGTWEKVQFWLDASVTTWKRALDDPSGRGVPALLSFSLARTSLLTQTANVIDQTPETVPYQYGRLYGYLAVALIPRFMWADKPSMNEANQFYQVAYGITRERDLDRTSIAVGTLTEGYINFSWGGTAGIMFLIGVLLDFWDATFLRREGALLARAIGIAMLPQLFIAEFQMAQYLSGIIQHVLLTTLVFIPIIKWRSGIARPMERRSLGIARGIASVGPS
jgi:hypothetical protein